MKTIYFKFNGASGDSFFSTPLGWIAVGDHPVGSQGTHLLSASCATISELEAQAARLKSLIDEAVKAAKGKLTATT